MGKPRAARKQPIVLSSDDEDVTLQPSPKCPKQRTLTSQATPKPRNSGRGDAGPLLRLQANRSRSPKPQSSSSSLPTPATIQETSSPSRLARPSRSKPPPSKPKPKWKPISSFFNAATQRQQTQPSASPEKPISSIPAEEEDFIQDSSFDEELAKIPDSKTEPATALALRKRGRSTLGDGVGAGADAPPSGSQKFLKTLNGTRGAPPSSQVTNFEFADQRPWTEKYGPINLDELAVHKKKVVDVRGWLDEVFAGRERKRLLLLKGPAGSGKTTTMSLLSKELGFEVHEWKNPTTAVYSSEGFVSIAAQFEDFIGRTGKFGSLDFGEPKRNPQVVTDSKSQNREKQIILVEEFPNTFARSSSVGQTFRTTIQQFLAANTPFMGTFFTTQKESSEPITPIIMIISETLLSTSTAAADSFTAHRLLGAEILSHPGVTVIEFNPIAPTLMAKALELVVLKEARKSGRRRTAGPQVIKRLSETGDIRSAVSSLEFLCVRGDEDDGWGTKVAFTKPKKGAREIPLTRMEQESLESVTQRESTLGIFHAVGKVVYNKREPASGSNQSLPQPPNYFPEHRRPKVSEVQVDTLIDELGTDTQTFIAALHENYLLSCEGPTGEDTMDSINGSIDALSDSDLLSPDRFNTGGTGRRMFQGTSADNLRQDEMSFQVSVRGLLFSLPSPVKRIAPPLGTTNGKRKGGSKGGAFQMFYPTSLRIWRQREEIEGILGLWTTRAQNGDLFTPTVTTAARKENKPGSVESWRRNNPFSQSPKKAPTSSTTSTDHAREDTAPVVLGSGSSARYEMLLERLPYVASILRHRLSTAIMPTLREIEKVVSFTGIGGPSDEFPNEDDPAPEFDQWSTDRPASQHSPEDRRKTGKFIADVKQDHEATRLPGIVEKEVAKLVLSDDDIED